MPSSNRDHGAMNLGHVDGLMNLVEDGIINVQSLLSKAARGAVMVVLTLAGMIGAGAGVMAGVMSFHWRRVEICTTQK